MGFPSVTYSTVRLLVVLHAFLSFLLSFSLNINIYCFVSVRRANFPLPIIIRSYFFLFIDSAFLCLLILAFFFNYLLFFIHPINNIALWSSDCYDNPQNIMLWLYCILCKMFQLIVNITSPALQLQFSSRIPVTYVLHLTRYCQCFRVRAVNKETLQMEIWHKKQYDNATLYWRWKAIMVMNVFTNPNNAYRNVAPWQWRNVCSLVKIGPCQHNEKKHQFAIYRVFF